MNKKTSLSILNAAEKRAEKELKFSIKCKNDGIAYNYDLSTRKHIKSNLKIASILSWALYKQRNSIGHTSRISIIEGMQCFFTFLNINCISNPKDLNKDTHIYYIAWLKKEANIKYSTAGSRYRKLATTFRVMNKHKNIANDFLPITNAFPKSTELATPNEGYSESELKMILKAITKELRTNKPMLENKYIPDWIGKPAPLDDVADISKRGVRSIWSSFKHLQWWWENNCECKPLNRKEIERIPKGYQFIEALREHSNGNKDFLNNFYSTLNVNKDYTPKYYGIPSPIKYKTPWKKMDYLSWYWENYMNCMPTTIAEAKKDHPKFYGALKEYKIPISNFLRSKDTFKWLQTSDLIPYYLILLIRTGANPSTIQRLTTDCLIRDPLNENNTSIDWIKFRSFKKGKTIPISTNNDNWPVMIIKRVINITQSIRGKENNLWIGNSNVHKTTAPILNTAFKRQVRNFSIEHKLKHDDGSPLYIQAQLIRPTIAWHEYLRTEDMTYLQALLAHNKITTTADYLRRLNDPIFLLNRTLHQEAMFIGITKNNIKKEVSCTENILNHCKNPITNEEKKTYCTESSESCLGCQNLVITIKDIKKHYCFINYYKYMFDIGDISESEHSKLTSNKLHIWNTQILPRYPKDLLLKIESDAIKSPIQEWDTSNYEQSK